MMSEWTPNDAPGKLPYREQVSGVSAAASESLSIGMGVVSDVIFREISGKILSGLVWETSRTLRFARLLVAILVDSILQCVKSTS